MSSHREAPEISKDPVADNCDFYAFTSPDAPDTVTFVATYIPTEAPAGGPNFYEFGDDVRYNIYIDNDGDGNLDIGYYFLFQTKIRNPNTFLYNTGPISSNTDPNWNRPQVMSVYKVDEKGHETLLGKNLTCPPCNIGPRSTSNYAALSQAAVHKLPTGEKVFAGQARDPFYVDLGSVFDLLALRPFQSLQRFPPKTDQPGVDARMSANIHAMAIQVPKSHLTRDGSTPTNQANANSVIGAWAFAQRHKATIREPNGKKSHAGPFVQVSRLGQPLINEVIIPMSQKDAWNSRKPLYDVTFLPKYEHPEVQGLLVLLYPGVFPHLAAYTKPRADLVYILLKGIPPGVIPNFQNFTTNKPSDMLRLNMAIPPAAKPSVYGILGGDLAGYPNGRRLFDDSTTVELRAIAGATIPLVDPSYTADAAASAIYDVTPPTVPGDRYSTSFPYLGLPLSGYDVPPA